MTLRARVHHVLEAHNLSTSAKIVRLLLAVLIVANVVAIVIETVPEVQRRAGTWLRDFELVTLWVFATEYLLRLWSAGEHAHYRGIVGRLRWMITPGAVIDLIAILPAMLPASAGNLRLVRILRLARLVRIAKLGRYSLALRTLRHVVYSRLPDLVSLSFVLLILLVLSSAAMYHLEHDAQPDAFSSIPATMWWGIVTLTTIGYGDMAPVTIEGRLLGSIVAVLGIGMFALPAGLLGGAFVEELRRARAPHQGQSAGDPAHCPHCGEPLGSRTSAAP